MVLLPTVVPPSLLINWLSTLSGNETEGRGTERRRPSDSPILVCEQRKSQGKMKGFRNSPPLATLSLCGGRKKAKNLKASGVMEGETRQNPICSQTLLCCLAPLPLLATLNHPRLSPPHFLVSARQGNGLSSSDFSVRQGMYIVRACLGRDLLYETIPPRAVVQGETKTFLPLWHYSPLARI